MYTHHKGMKMNVLHRAQPARSGIRAVNSVLILLLLGAAGGFAQTVNFNYQGAPTFVANTGRSEVLGQVVFAADAACGTSVDAACVSSSGTIQVTYLDMIIDNTTATGISICETLAGAQTCNGAGTYLSGSFSVQQTQTGGVVSFGIRAGANFASGDQVTVTGVRGRIDQTAMAAPGTSLTAMVTVSPVIAAAFSPTSEIIARSEDPLSVELPADPLVPCLVTDPAAVVQVSEVFSTAFVDHGDASEVSFPGQPVSARPLFAATNSSRITLTLVGLVPGIVVNWPVTVPAVAGAAVLDRVSQSADGSTVTYAFGTPNQAVSDVDIESFDITLTSANFTFSGHELISGNVTIQGQMSPLATPATTRPRYNHPMEPVPALPFLALRRCNTTSGTLTVHAQVDGLTWQGALEFQLTGPSPVTGSRVPQIYDGMLAGSYTLQRISGGPAGATFTGYTPTSSVVPVGGTRLFMINFTGPTVANLELSSTAPAVCPAAGSTVGTIQLKNTTADDQIIPGGTSLVFTFSSPVAAAPTTADLGSITPVVSGSSVRFELPASLRMAPGQTLTFTGARLNLGAVGNGQNVTMQFTTLVPGAVQVPTNQVAVASANTSLCSGLPPQFTSSGVTNAASFVSGLAPGGIATLFGTRLSNVSGIVLASGAPLPTQIQGTSVTVNGVAAPLFAVANVNGQEQINFQVPWEFALAGPAMATVVVTNNGLASAPVQVPIALMHAGMFLSDPVFGAILHGQSLAPVTPSDPAAPNEVVILFATGVGPVSANPGTGNPALASPLSMCSVNITVTVSGQERPADFCGLAPGFVGLYQINFRLPANLTPGNYNVHLSGTSTNSPLIPVQ
jgi:uncharacterized protein (TIGR03437 family)